MNVAWARVSHLEVRRASSLLPGARDRKRPQVIGPQCNSRARPGGGRGFHGQPTERGGQEPTCRARVRQFCIQEVLRERSTFRQQRCYAKQSFPGSSQHSEEETTIKNNTKDKTNAHGPTDRLDHLYHRLRERPEDEERKRATWQAPRSGALPTDQRESFFSTYQDVVLEDQLDAPRQVSTDRTLEREGTSAAASPKGASVSSRVVQHPVHAVEADEFSRKTAAVSRQWNDFQSSEEFEDPGMEEYDNMYDFHKDDDVEARDFETSGNIVDVPGVPDQTFLKHRRPVAFQMDDDEDFDHREPFAKGLENGDLDTVLRCLFAAKSKKDHDFLSTISNESISQIVRLLEPSDWVEELLIIHRDFSGVMLDQADIARGNQIAYECTEMLLLLLEILKLSGAKLSLTDYTSLLRSARTFGSQKLASRVWSSIYRNGLVPDIACYNLYMAAHVWRGAHRPVTRNKLRVIPYNMLQRERRRRQVKYHNFGVGADGIFDTTRWIFDNMLSNCGYANEESFSILIIAAAREGQIETVKSLLKRTWGVDVDKVMTGGEPSAISAIAFEEDSPLRPTSKLLFAIAHSFSINNDVPSAIRVVDFVARQYKLKITREVWEELFEWTFVLSVPRTGNAQQGGATVGQLPPDSVEHLWNTMTGDPYNIEPTMTMYDRMIKSFCNRTMTPWMVEKMTEGIHLYRRHKREANTALVEFREAVSVHKPDTTLRSSRRKWEYRDLVRQRDNYLVRRWLALLLLSFEEWHRRDFVEQHYARGLPTVLWEWRRWAPSLVEYETPTVVIELAIRSPEEMDIARAIKAARHADLYSPLLHAAPLFIGESWVRGGDDVQRKSAGAQLK